MPFSILKILEVICAKIAIISALVMSLVIVCDVIGRSLFNQSLGFSYEVVAISLGVMFYSGLYHVHKTRSHISIDLLDKFYRGKVGLFVFWFVYIIECVFFTAIVYALFAETQSSKSFGDVFLFLGILKWKVLLAVSVFALIAWVSLFVTPPKHN